MIFTCDEQDHQLLAGLEWAVEESATLTDLYERINCTMAQVEKLRSERLAYIIHDEVSPLTLCNPALLTRIGYPS
jgi:hypothetical protein